MALHSVGAGRAPSGRLDQGAGSNKKGRRIVGGNKPLTIVLGDHGQTKALKDGVVKVRGVDLDFVNVKPMQDVTMTITKADGSTKKVTLTLRIDTGIEVDYLTHGGILPYVLRELLAAA